MAVAVADDDDDAAGDGTEVTGREVGRVEYLLLLAEVEQLPAAATARCERSRLPTRGRSASPPQGNLPSEDARGPVRGRR